MSGRLSRSPDVSSVPVRDLTVPLGAGPYSVLLPPDAYSEKERFIQFDLRDSVVVSGIRVATDRDNWLQSFRVSYAPWTVLHPERVEPVPRGDATGGQEFFLFEREAAQQDDQRIERTVLFPQPIKTNRCV